jgi:pimeloyl-ACP methyl ester carboxylesterase
VEFPYPGERSELSPATRKFADGQFVLLPDGLTHYEIGGPADGPVIVLVCGFSVPYFIFDSTFAFLVSAGARVVRYDLFGRGWSDRPRASYDLSFFTRQLGDLLSALQVTSLSLVGLSMGGPIAAASCVRFSGAVHKLVLIDPCGSGPLPLHGVHRVSQVPLLGELALTILGQRSLLRSIAADFVSPQNATGLVDRYREQMQFRGFRRALLSTIRSGMFESFLDIYEKVGQMDLPTLLVWGTEDHTVPFTHSIRLRSAMPRALFRPIGGAGHVPHYEHPAQVNPILEEFLL